MSFLPLRQFKSDLFSPVGCKEHKLYREILDKNGVPDLEESGSVDIYEMIQSQRESTDIHRMIDLYMRTGDISALTKQQASFYSDVTNMPTTLLEAQQHMLRTRSLFDSLPANVKKEFDNSYGQFLNSINTKAGQAILKQVFGHVSKDAAPKSSQKVDEIIQTSGSTGVLHNQASSSEGGNE